MVSLREMFTAQRTVTRLGAISFPTNIFRDEKRTPHYEMHRSLELFEMRPMINSAVKQLARFIIGGTISAKSADQRSHDFLNAWIKQRENLQNEVSNMCVSALCTNNVFAERSWKEMVNHQWVLDNVFNINDVSRVYYNLDAQSKENQTAEERMDSYWLYEVPIEIRQAPFGGVNLRPKFWKVNYVYASYLYAKMIWAVGIHQSKIDHCKFGWSRDGIYGRGFLASCIDDGEILTEILKNFATIARYRAIGRKIISIGDVENVAGTEDILKIRDDLNSLPENEHLIINKPFKSEPLSYTNENDPMQNQVDFLRKDISSGLVPNYLTPWNSEVNRATAMEAKIPFELEINSFRQEMMEFLNRLIIKELRKVYTWLADDATFTCGVIDFETKDEKVRYGNTLFTANIITLNEFRKLVGYETVESGDKFLKDLVDTTATITGGRPMPAPRSESRGGSAFRILKEQLSPEDSKFLRAAEGSTSIIQSREIRGKKIRLVKAETGYLVYDGKSLLKDFLPDERPAAQAFYDVTVVKRERSLDDFYDQELIEHKVWDAFFDEVKRVNVEAVEEVFKQLGQSKVHSEGFKEQMVLGKDMLPKLDQIFARFDARLSDIVAKAVEDLYGIAIQKIDVLGRDVAADDKARQKLREIAEIIKQRVHNELKTMHGSMKQDIFRRLSDAVVTNKPIGELKQELKDEYSYYKTKENPQDWKIDRVARTELANGTILMKLSKWKEMGFSKVEHLTVIDDKTGEKDREFNRRVFEIDYLLSNDEDRIPLHPNCFPAGTKILTRSGEKPIEKIKVGDVVRTHKNRWRLVIGTMSRKYVGDLYRYKALIGTPGHPIFIKGRFIPLKKLSNDAEYAKCVVYNIEVEEDESYVANGIKVHNCRCTYVAYE